MLKIKCFNESHSFKNVRLGISGKKYFEMILIY